MPVRPRTIFSFASAFIVACPLLAGAEPIAYDEEMPAYATTYSLPTARTIELLAAASETETDPVRRVVLAGDLARAKSPAAVAALTRLLKDADPFVRAAAVKGLVQSGAAGEPGIAALANDESPMVRQEVARAGVRAAVIAGLKDADPTVQIVAVASAWGVATDELLAALPSLPPHLQAIASSTLTERDAGTALPALASLLTSESPVVRVAALQALGRAKALTRVQADQQLAHPHPSVRTASLEAAFLSLKSDEERHALALRGLADPEPAVRVPAARMIGSVAASDTATALRDQLSVGYEPLRREAVEQLAAAAAKFPSVKQPVIDVAAALLNDPDVERQIDGSFVLGRLQSPQAYDKHLSLLASPDWRVAGQAAKAMGLIGNPVAGEALTTLTKRALQQTDAQPAALTDSRYAAAESAILSAAQLRHEPILAATASLLLFRTAPPPPRRAAIWAVGVLSSPEAVATALAPMLDRLNDMQESGDAIIESMKALGNAGATSLTEKLQNIHAGSQIVQYRWAAHRALVQLKAPGFTGEFDPALAPVEPPASSIESLTPAAK
ncbi:MAG TPA: HEAT repeat domain-containing protein [Tepidisphaeraceae bacterium]